MTQSGNTAMDGRSAGRVVVVEDEAIVARDLKEQLLRLGYEVPAVFDRGEEVVEQIETLRADLVLMDIFLKGEMDGTEAARRIRASQQVPVIFLTAYSDAQTLMRAKLAEPFGYILKPFDERDLQVTVEMALYRRGVEKTLLTTQQELEEQRGRVMRSDRLRSLGEMAAGIAHELSQPLVGVRGIAEHIKLGIERGWETSEEKLSSQVTQIMDQADRMVHIIQHVRMFAREAGKPDRSDISVNDVVTSAIEMLGAQFRSHGLELDAELADDLPAVLANPFSLEEVILNLLSNARDALEADGTGTEERARVRVCTSARMEGASPGVLIEVVDNGPGISKAILPLIMEPFFTTKDPDKGTGLGLSICKSIVEEFDGAMEVTSPDSGGTTVSISFLASSANGQTPEPGDLSD